MLKRLEKVQPIYKVSDWVEDWQRKEELTSMITCYPASTQSEDNVIALAEKVANIVLLFFESGLIMIFS